MLSVSAYVSCRHRSGKGSQAEQKWMSSLLVKIGSRAQRRSRRSWGSLSGRHGGGSTADCFRTLAKGNASLRANEPYWSSGAKARVNLGAQMPTPLQAKAIALTFWQRFVRPCILMPHSRTILKRAAKLSRVRACAPHRPNADNPP